MTEQQLRQTISLLDIRRSQLENISRQQELIRASIEEHLRAKETLDNYKNTKDNEEVLVPVGAGVFIRVKAGNRTTAISTIGSGVLLEREIGEISNQVDTRISELRKTGEDLSIEAERISATIEELSKEAQRQYSAFQKSAQDKQTK